jgi:hypothetical protein
LNVAEGSIYLNVKIKGYYTEYVDDIFIYEEETLTIDFPLEKKLKETAKVYGYVTDNSNGNPIEGASIYLHWEDGNDHYDSNNSDADSNGYYSMNVARGIIYISAGISGYFYEDRDEINIEENATVRIDFSLDRRPVENVIIKGFITDDLTNEPLMNAYILMSWNDGDGHHYVNRTQSDKEGFYQIHVPQHGIELQFHLSGYESHSISEINLQNHEYLWMNVSLTMETLNVFITRPGKGIYFKDNWIFPRFLKTLIIGNIEIEAQTSTQISKVEFYIDGFLKKTDTTEPYTYQWTKSYFVFHRHIIKVKAYNEYGDTDMDRLMVKKYF